jgi:hypothetical protein
VTKRKKLLLGAFALSLPLLGFAIYWFAPYYLFIDAKVNEPAPKDMVVVASGTFQTLEHGTKGSAELIADSQGNNKHLRLLDLQTSNGPQLHVYLSSVPAQKDWFVYDDAEYIDLGPLKGNIGTSYYAIPEGTNTSKLVSAVVWCKRFSVGFGVAPLTPRSPEK